MLNKVRIRLPVGRSRTRSRTRPGAVAADRAYSSRANRAHLYKRHIKAVVPEKKDQAVNRKKRGSRGRRPVTCDIGLYKKRNTVERLINRLKDRRGIVTRFDKTPESQRAGLEPSASMVWLEDLPRAAD